jgi:hypothetical protein
MRYWFLAGLCLAAPVQAGEISVSAVDFAPAVAVKMQDEYGQSEAATLRSAIVSAVARASGRAPARCTVAVTVRDVAPTHPTRRQSADNPALDVIRTRYLGGADLRGELRDSKHQALGGVSYRYYAPALALGSISVDAWGDARLAIDGFAARLASACREAPAR